MRKPSILYKLLYGLNTIGILMSLIFAKIYGEGGSSLGYILFGFGITGAITLLIALAGILMYGREMFNSSSKIAVAIILLLVCIWEVSFIFYLKLWR